MSSPANPSMLAMETEEFKKLPKIRSLDTETPKLQPPAPPQAAAAPASTRGRMLGILAAAAVFAAAGFGGYWYFVGSRFVSTDNAYVAAEVAEVTPSVGGTVKEVNVVDTQHVKKGDVLVVIDDIDAKLALAQAEAELGRAERRVKGYFANNEGLAAQVDASRAAQVKAEAVIASARADLSRAKTNLDRRERLASTGAVSAEDLTNARNTYATAQANLAASSAEASRAAAAVDAAAGALTASQVLTEQTTVDTNPEVALARAKRDQAKVDLERTIIRSPVDGVIARRQVQVGQRLGPGAVLMNIVPVSGLHVDANFKEVQLEKVRIGQPVELQADVYGGNVKYHGHVTGFSGGTGAAFALIPAQNATGNWIKVVQRVPVRVELDPAELAAHPLAVGLSMEATIDISADGAGTLPPVKEQ